MSSTIDWPRSRVCASQLLWHTYHFPRLCAVALRNNNTKEATSARVVSLSSYLKSKVKVSRDRPRWPKGFRVG